MISRAFIFGDVPRTITVTIDMYCLLLVFFLPFLLVSPVRSTLSDGPFGLPSDPGPLEIDTRRMFCDGNLPRGRYGNPLPVWNIRARLARTSGSCRPDAWSAANFTTLADLCTAHGNRRGNMGGMVKAKFLFLFFLLALLKNKLNSYLHLLAVLSIDRPGLQPRLSGLRSALGCKDRSALPSTLLLPLQRRQMVA